MCQQPALAGAPQQEWVARTRAGAQALDEADPHAVPHAAICAGVHGVPQAPALATVPHGFAHALVLAALPHGVAHGVPHGVPQGAMAPLPHGAPPTFRRILITRGAPQGDPQPPFISPNRVEEGAGPRYQT